MLNNSFKYKTDIIVTSEENIGEHFFITSDYKWPKCDPNLKGHKRNTKKMVNINVFKDLHSKSNHM